VPVVEATVTPADSPPVAVPTLTPGIIIEPTLPGAPGEAVAAGPPATPILLPTSPAQPTGPPVGPVLSSGPGRLTFTEGNTNSVSEIVIMNDDGTDRLMVTENDAYDGEPDFSPDGSQIAFESSRFGNIDILVMGNSGENVRRLTDSPQEDRHPDWSPDSRVVVFESGFGSSSEIFAINADGSGAPVQLTTNGYGDRAPQFSPDGTLIAFMTERRGRWQIALMRFPGGEQVTLFDCPATDCRFPTWSPDGKLIAFNTINTEGRVDAIYTLNPATGETRVVIEGGQNGRPVYNGDGTSIYFNRTVDTISGIYRFDLQSNQVTRITDPAIDVYAPDWGPR
jgi:Tol biopolymer transport system component